MNIYNIMGNPSKHDPSLCYKCKKPLKGGRIISSNDGSTHADCEEEEEPRGLDLNTTFVFDIYSLIYRHLYSNPELK